MVHNDVFALHHEVGGVAGDDGVEGDRVIPPQGFLGVGEFRIEDADSRATAE